jgi:hypothetical protein
MNRRQFSQFALAGLTAATALKLSAQDRDDRREGHDWERGRELVRRTMEDMRHLERRESFAGDERGHYEGALQDLERFDRSLDERHFDRDRLDQAIARINDVTRSRMLDERERERLSQDLADLRRFREEWH